MKLLDIIPSQKKTKKYTAIFDNNGKMKYVDFGAVQNGKPMDDYTITHDVHQRTRYITRHLKDLQTGDPTKPGFLSLFILWGASTDINKNITYYKHLFNL